MNWILSQDMDAFTHIRDHFTKYTINADQFAALISDDPGSGKSIGMMLHFLHSCRKAKVAKDPYRPIDLIVEPRLMDSFINDWINYFSESGLVIRKFHGYKAGRANDASRRKY